MVPEKSAEQGAEAEAAKTEGAETEAKNTEAEKTEVEKLEAEKAEAEKAGTEKTGTEKKDAKLFLDGLTSLVERTIREGGEVPLKGLGKFKVVARQARTGRNPQTGEPIQIPAKTVVRFTIAKALKDLIKT